MVRFLVGLFIFILSIFQAETLKAANQREGFEKDFQIVNHPEEFIPGWSGNELRASSSRIFQSSQGRNASKALAVQPISTFDGKVFIRLNPNMYENPKIQFWARAVRNGSGTRPAVVFYSFEKSLENDPSNWFRLGSENEFANEDQEFRKFEILLPEELSAEPEIFLKLEIRFGSGTGSCARFLMDDFEFGDIEEDLEAPKILRVRGYDNKTIELSFSEKLDPVFSQIQLNYLMGEKEPESAILRQDSLVYLSFEDALDHKGLFDLRVRQIADLEGNFLEDTLVNFTFFDPTNIPYKTLVINELMPAPRDGNDLPNVEYIELLHIGDYPVRVEGVQISNSRNTTTLGNFWLEPDSYTILAPTNQANQFLPFGSVIPVSSWPTLLNSGDRVQLSDRNGKEIDQVSYTTASWKGTEFSGGGYSLEVVNPFLRCDQSSFLLSSRSSFRGTPGQENSVFDLSPDLVKPELLAFEFLNEQTLVLTFSEPLQTLYFPNFLSFQEIIEIDSVGINSDEVTLFFQNPFPENNPVTLKIHGFQDCSGNELEEIEIIIIRPSEAQIGDVMINEVLFNSRTGSPKFVQLINVPNRYLELRDWKLANLDAQGKVNQVRAISDRSLVIPPKAQLAISTDTVQLKFDYPLSSMGLFHQINTLPSYPIAGGTVVLLAPSDELAESFRYSERLHHPLLRDTKGVSLERISLQTPASVMANWHSASGTMGYATPGIKNSQLIEEEFLGNIIQIDPEVFDPEGSNGNTFTSIRYELNEPGWVGTFRIYDMAGRIVAILAQNEILGTSGLYSWTGTNSNGGRVRTGYYILVADLFDLNGNVRQIKKTIIIAERL